MLTCGLLLGGAASSAHANQLVEITVPARKAQIPDVWLRYPSPPRARVLLPDGYDPGKRYPLLVLLAGASSSYKTWSISDLGRIKTTAAGFPGIIVMPEGATGFYTDWWNGGRRGDPSWETYILDDVLPQILARYPIRPERRWHALAGVSMGGLGTAYLGGRVPGFFGSIALISGVPDLALFPGMSDFAALVPQATAGQPFDGYQVYGSPDGFYAQGHSPMRLAANLQHTRVFMAAGDGTPTSDGEPNGNSLLSDTGAEVVLVRPGSDHYAQALTDAGVDLTYQPHQGIHDFANFRRELRDAIAWNLFAPVAEHPTSWVNDTVATHGELWGVQYRFDAAPDRIVRFRRAGGRLSVGAAGSPVTLTTDGGCRFRIATPGAIGLPAAPCAKPAAAPAVKPVVRVSPRRLATGRWRTVRVAVTPAIDGTVVRAGGRRASTDADGVAYLPLCAGTSRGLRVAVAAPGRPGARVRLRASGRPRPCPAAAAARRGRTR